MNLDQKSRSRRYDDYRNHLKLSKQSEEQRYRRVQQMAEAQKLLESNCISNHKVAKTAEIRNGVEHDILDLEFEKQHGSTNIKVDDHEEHLEDSNKIKRKPWYLDNEFSSNLQTSNLPEDKRALSAESTSAATRIKQQTTVSDDQEYLAQSSSNSSKCGIGSISRKTEISSSIRQSSECPKIRQLKERMLRRRNQRHQQMLALPSSIVHTSKEQGNKKYVHVRADEERSRQAISDRDALDFKYHKAKEGPSIHNDQSSLNHNAFDSIKEKKYEVGEKQTLLETGDGKISSRMDYDMTIDYEESVVDVQLIYCHHCQKSYAPETYKKFCQSFDEYGVPKCVAMRNKKRKIYNSAKARIINNENLTSDAQQLVISSRKKVVSELRQKAQGKTSTRSKKSLWKQQSTELREAMRSNRLISKAEKEGRPPTYYL